MGDRKTIEISAPVYDRLVDQKGTDTWDTYLGKLFEASYGETAYLDATTLEDFGADETTDTSDLQVPAEGDIEVVVETADGSPLASLNVPTRPDDDTVRVRLRDRTTE